MPSYPIAAVLKLPELFASSQSSRRRRIEAGSYAMSAPMIETEAAYVERIEAAIGIEVWPRQDIGLVATDAASGTACVLNRECGATIAAAVAASCCLPGLSPPVAIGGRHYMDGGMRSAANADLARGFDSILVLCFHPPGPPGARVLARVSAQSEVLIGGGASVSVIAPDAASLAAIGPRTMDLVRRPAVARAGLELGEHSADLIERFWGKTGQPLR
jgi:NTE family protein